MPRTFSEPGTLSAPVGQPSPVAPIKRPQTDRNTLATQLSAELFGVNQASQASSTASSSRFNSLPFTLRDLALQRQELQFRQRTGLRDIGQEREEGLEAATNNALQRGVFRSGILTRNQSRVNREADEAASDLKETIRIAMAKLQNREGLARASEAHAAAQAKASSPAGTFGGLERGQIQSIFTDFFKLAEAGELDPRLESRVRAIEMIRRGFNDQVPAALDANAPRGGVQ